MFHVRCLAKQGASTDLASSIRCISDHVSAQHENSGTWCKRNNESDVQTVKLTDEK